MMLLCRELEEKDGIHCNLTLLFSFCQVTSTIPLSFLFPFSFLSFLFPSSSLSFLSLLPLSSSSPPPLSPSPPPLSPSPLLLSLLPFLLFHFTPSLTPLSLYSPVRLLLVLKLVLHWSPHSLAGYTIGILRTQTTSPLLLRMIQVN